MTKTICILLLSIFWAFNLFAQNNYSIALEAHAASKGSKAKRCAKLALKEVAPLQKSELYTLLARYAYNDLFRLSNKKTLNYLDSALHYNPQNAFANYLFGHLQIDSKPTIGEKHLKLAVDLDSSTLPAIVALVYYYAGNDNEKATIDYANVGLKILTDSLSAEQAATKIDLLFNKGAALFQSEQLEEAIVALDRVLALDTIEFLYTDLSHYMRGACYNDLDEYDKAFVDLELLATIPAYRKDAYLTYHLAWAYAYKSKPDFEKALYYIETSTKLSEKDASSDAEDLGLCYVLRGNIYLELNESELAIDDFLKLKEEESRSFWLATAYYQAKEYKKSIKHYLEYLEDYPNDLEALLETSRCYYQLGNLEKACEYISESIEYYSEETIEEAEDLQKAMLLKLEYCQ